MDNTNKSVTEIRKDVLGDLIDFFKTQVRTSILKETERFYNGTKLPSNLSLDYQMENSSWPSHDNASLKGQNYTSVYSLYPSWILWFGAIFCILFAIFGSTGNFISMLALVRCKRLRNATTTFIVNLCVSDMLYCGFTMPLTALTFIDRDWKNGDVLCKMYALSKYSNGMVSIFTVVAITINRYVLIVHPRIYRKVYNTKTMIIMIGCLWILPLIVITFSLFRVWGALIYNPANGDCGVNDVNGRSPRAFIFVIIIIIPSILFVACYLKVYFVVKRSVGFLQKQEEFKMPSSKTAPGENGRQQRCDKLDRSSVNFELRDKKEFRVMRIALVLFLVYMCSIFPISLMKLSKKESQFQILNILAYIFYYTSSVVNPIIYIAMSREYRMAYKELFVSKLCCSPDTN